jgi:hypothetical protein
MRWLQVLFVPALIGPVVGPPTCGSATREVIVEQPIEFDHEAHLGYLTSGEHRNTMVRMHLEALELDEEDAPAQMWTCTQCHARDQYPRCFGCHELYWERKLRARENVRACVGCHRGAWAGSTANIPTTGACAECHAEPLQTGEGADQAPSAQETLLRRYIERGEQLPWMQINTLPGHVYFSHSAHVRYAEMSCVDCHGDMNSQSVPPTHAIRISMDACVSCHEANGGGTDCLACHK